MGHERGPFITLKIFIIWLPVTEMLDNRNWMVLDNVRDGFHGVLVNVPEGHIY